MDPDETLAILRRVAEQALTYMEKAEEWDPDILGDYLTIMAERFESLDGWIMKDGYLPQSWDNGIVSEF